MKKIETAVSTVCIAVIIAVQAAFSTAFAADSGDWAALAEECFGYFSGSDGEFWSSAADSNSDWAAYCCARLHGSEGSEAYAAQLENRISELAETVSSGGFVKPTELQRTGIFLAAMGHDPSQAVELGVFQSETLGRQGFNAYIWALIALNVTGETAPDNSLNTAQSLTEYIVASQHDDGSFSLFGDGGDVDITSAAVYALASADSDEAQEAAQRGADWLCEIEGGYTSMGVRNCESTAQAVIALAAAGRTEKAEEAACQLAEYRRPDGGYAHLPDGGHQPHGNSPDPGSVHRPRAFTARRGAVFRAARCKSGALQPGWFGRHRCFRRQPNRRQSGEWEHGGTSHSRHGAVISRP